MGKPIHFAEQNTVVAKDQQGVLPLPAFVDKDVTIACWEITEEELAEIIATKRIWVCISNFSRPLQPSFVTGQRSQVLIDG